MKKQSMNDEVKKPSREAQIDQSLKKVYEEVLQEELPDRLKDLLAKLKAQDDGSGNLK